MLQKELAKRLRGRFETEPDGDGWLAVSSDGMPLCRVKYNGNCIVNDNPYLSEEYLGKISEVQNDLLTVKEYVGLYKHAPLCGLHQGQLRNADPWAGTTA